MFFFLPCNHHISEGVTAFCYNNTRKKTNNFWKGGLRMIKILCVVGTGLVLLVLCLVFGTNAAFRNLLPVFWKKPFRRNRLDLKAVKQTPPKLLALCVAARQEAAVVEAFVDNLMATCVYPVSMFHLFLSVTSNDRDVIVVERLAQKYPNVHPVINRRPGLTSEVQLLNGMFRRIREYEEVKGIRFASFIFHDAGDAVHPYELAVTNCMIDRYNALRFPMLPGRRTTSVKKFLHRVVLPAGTAIALSRKAVEACVGEVIFPETPAETSLFFLSLYGRFLPMHTVREKLPRVQRDGSVRYELIATRPLHPIRSMEENAIRLGDTILMHGFVSPAQIAKALHISGQRGIRLGEYLRANRIVSEEQLLEALADVQHTLYIRDRAAERILPEHLDDGDFDLLYRNCMLPLAEKDGTVILAICGETPAKAIRNLSSKNIRTVFMSKNSIMDHLNRSAYETIYIRSETNSLLTREKISFEQALLILNFSTGLGRTEVEVLSEMGLNKKASCEIIRMPISHQGSEEKRAAVFSSVSDVQLFGPVPFTE